MSHFTVGVLVPGPILSDSMADSAVEYPLQPFDEKESVEPYTVRMEEDEVERMLDFYRRKTLGQVAGLSEREVNDLEPQTVIDLLAAHGQKIEREDLLDRLEDWCGNEGGIDEEGMWHWSDYNPDSKWDWYEVGGRWSGMLQGVNFKPVTEVLAFFDANADAREQYAAASKKQDEAIAEFVIERAKAEGREVLEGDALRTAISGVKWALRMGGVKDATDEVAKTLELDLDEEVVKQAATVNFRAMLAIDGEWLQKGEMGYFGMSSGDKGESEWMDIQMQALREAVAEDPDCVLVVVDCHI